MSRRLLGSEERSGENLSPQIWRGVEKIALSGVWTHHNFCL
jgi:hypothetical protein